MLFLVAGCAAKQNKHETAEPAVSEHEAQIQQPPEDGEAVNDDRLKCCRPWSKAQPACPFPKKEQCGQAIYKDRFCEFCTLDLAFHEVFRKVTRLPTIGSLPVLLKNGQDQRYILNFYNDDKTFIEFLKEREEEILKSAKDHLSGAHSDNGPNYSEIAEALLGTIMGMFDPEKTADIGDVRLALLESDDRGFMPPEESNPSIPVVQSGSDDSE